MPEETDRFRALGRDAGVAVGTLCRTIEAGASELDVAARLISSLAAVGARTLVVLVAADARIAAFRHPLPTDARWRNTLLLACCAERHGLVVAFSRMVSAGSVSPDLVGRTRQTAGVYGALLRKTADGVTAAALYAAAAEAYRHAGFPGEEQRHHQGGAIGYKSREWVAHPSSPEIVQLPQAFAWNPSITGTKVEETALVSDDGIELVTASPGWPSIPIEVNNQTLAVPDILVRDA
jgi:antitoxin VapB